MFSPIAREENKVEVYRSVEAAVLPDAVFRAAFDALRREGGAPASAAGRGAVKIVPLNDGGAAVIRLYRRGGLMRRFSRQTFLRGFQETRVRRELEVLEHLQTAGVAAAEPLGGIVEWCASGLCYSAAIAVRRIGGAENMLERIRDNPPAADARHILERAAFSAGLQAGRMMRAGVFHTDLHPGNVLLSPDGGVVLIDFDRAKRFDPECDLPYRMGRTIQRWERATAKHGFHMRDWVDEPFIEGLRTG